jgi:hypothetical protein
MINSVERITDVMHKQPAGRVKGGSGSVSDKATEDSVVGIYTSSHLPD